MMVLSEFSDTEEVLGRWGFNVSKDLQKKKS